MMAVSGAWSGALQLGPSLQTVTSTASYDDMIVHLDIETLGKPV